MGRDRLAGYERRGRLDPRCSRCGPPMGPSGGVQRGAGGAAAAPAAPGAGWRTASVTRRTAPAAVR
eukprot:6432226-Alexandrium_andersonii.AAC.1